LHNYPIFGHGQRVWKKGFLIDPENKKGKAFFDRA
jgi:hypothetical protein